MASNRLTVFEIVNLADLEGSYRLLHVRGLPRDPAPHRELSLLVKNISRQVQQPAVLVPQAQGYAVALPGDAPLPALQQPLTPHVATLIPEDRTVPLRFTALAGEEQRIAVGFLGWAIRGLLMRDRRLWGSGRRYFQKRPQPSQNGTLGVDIYQGFTVSVVQDAEGRLFVALDLAHRYIDSLWLPERVVDGDWSRYRFKHFLYHFGPQLYEVQLVNPTGNAIRQDFFTHPKTGQPVDVYTYTKELWGNGSWPYVRELNPDGPGVLYKYPGNDVQRHGAASLCKLIYPTEDPQVSKLHRRSIHRPDDRFRIASRMVEQHLQGAALNGVPVRISLEPHAEDLKAFPIPDLRYGNGVVLHVKRHRNDQGVDVRDYPRARMRHLLDADKGPWDVSPFRAQYLMLPLSLPREAAERFAHAFQSEMGRVSGQRYASEQVLYDDSSCRTLQQHVQEISGKLKANEITSGYVLLVLPPGVKKETQRDLHNFLKKEFWPQVQFQCARAEEIEKRAPFDAREAKSYLRYLALGMLQVNRKWPMVLDASLHYKAYIGIDVLNGRAGFTYLYQHEHGQDCYFQDARSQQQEKLTARQLRTVLYEHLKRDLPRLDLQTNAIVIHRDGRVFDSELEGMQRAIRQLKAEGYLDPSVQLAVVEIHKRSALPIRIAAELADGRLANPKIGTYRVLNAREGLVCTTGYPFDLQGTANPLHCKVVYGDVSILNVLEDVFALSQLAYSAPDKASRLPLTIKLADTFLEPIASDIDLDSALYEDEEVLDAAEAAAEEFEADSRSRGTFSEAKGARYG